MSVLACMCSVCVCAGLHGHTQRTCADIQDPRSSLWTTMTQHHSRNPTSQLSALALLSCSTAIAWTRMIDLTCLLALTVGKSTREEEDEMRVHLAG